MKKSEILSHLTSIDVLANKEVEKLLEEARAASYVDNYRIVDIKLNDATEIIKRKVASIKALKKATKNEDLIRKLKDQIEINENWILEIRLQFEKQ